MKQLVIKGDDYELEGDYKDTYSDPEKKIRPPEDFFDPVTSVTKKETPVPEGRFVFCNGKAVVLKDEVFSIHTAEWYRRDWPPLFVVTFDGNGGSVYPPAIKTQGLIKPMPTVSRAGYNFKGWYDAPTDGNPVISVLEDKTVYAQWVEIPKSSENSSTPMGVGFGYDPPNPDPEDDPYNESKKGTETLEISSIGYSSFVKVGGVPVCYKDDGVNGEQVIIVTKDGEKKERREQKATGQFIQNNAHVFMSS